MFSEMFSSDMLSGLLTNQYETVAALLFGIGFITLLLHNNIIKKIIGMNIMDTAVFLFLASNGYIEGRIAPYVFSGAAQVGRFVNPIPTGLVLTGIVVSVSTTAMLFALSYRLAQRFHTLNLDEILFLAKEGAQ